jgi:mRNA interferase RelE/StbE
MLLLERNPYAGAPLGHSLVGFRKLVVGDRAWRIIWRVQELDNGHTIIDIAEVWAVGTRSDDEVYNEMVRRVQSLDMTRPESVALAEIVKALVNARSLPAVVETVDPVPTWLADRLVKTAGLDGSAVAQMSLQQAVDAWTAIVSRNLGGGEG